MMSRLLFILLVISNTAFAQSNIISSFTGAQINQLIHLEFTIIAGETCNGIVIERSSDSLNFSKIGDIAGTCGSVSNPVDYAYADSFPINNANNYYRLAPGNADWSAVIKVFFKTYNKNDFFISPNPFITSTSISFQNPLNKNIHWKLYDMNGKKVKEGNTKDAAFTLSKNTLQTGLYNLYLTLDNTAFQKAKLIIE